MSDSDTRMAETNRFPQIPERTCESAWKAACHRPNCSPTWELTNLRYGKMTESCGTETGERTEVKTRKASVNTHPAADISTPENIIQSSKGSAGEDATKKLASFTRHSSVAKAVGSLWSEGRIADVLLFFILPPVGAAIDDALGHRCNQNLAEAYSTGYGDSGKWSGVRSELSKMRSATNSKVAAVPGMAGSG